MSSNLAGLAGHIWFYPCMIMASEAEKSFGSETRTSMYTELTNTYLRDIDHFK